MQSYNSLPFTTLYKDRSVFDFISEIKTFCICDCTKMIAAYVLLILHDYKRLFLNANIHNFYTSHKKLQLFKVSLEQVCRLFACLCIYLYF